MGRLFEISYQRFFFFVFCHVDLSTDNFIVKEISIGGSIKKGKKGVKYPSRATAVS